MNKARVIRDLATLESHLQRCNVPYFTVLGHYRRWLATATPDEEPLIQERIYSLFGGQDTLNDIYISRDAGHTTEDEIVANGILDRTRTALYESLSAEPDPTDNQVQLPYKVNEVEKYAPTSGKLDYSGFMISFVIFLCCGSLLSFVLAFIWYYWSQIWHWNVIH